LQQTRSKNVYFCPPLNAEIHTSEKSERIWRINHLSQATYPSEASATLIKRPRARIAVIRAIVEKLGGTLFELWGSFGEHEIVLIIDFSDTMSSVAIKMAAFAGGALRDGLITPLCSPEEG
jgi:uncharacterized protein with GYD domain